MKYMLLIYNRPGFVEELSEDERTALFGEVEAIMKELEESGEMVGGQALADPSEAKIVRAAGTAGSSAGSAGGPPAVTDGPFVEAKEHLAGHITVDCETLDRAVEIASRWPDVRYGGYMEVRAIMGGSGTEM